MVERQVQNVGIEALNGAVIGHNVANHGGATIAVAPQVVSIFIAERNSDRGEGVVVSGDIVDSCGANLVQVSQVQVRTFDVEDGVVERESGTIRHGRCPFH